MDFFEVGNGKSFLANWNCAHAITLARFRNLARTRYITLAILTSWQRQVCFDDIIQCIHWMVKLGVVIKVEPGVIRRPLHSGFKLYEIDAFIQ